jgi:hypothetical protein
MGMFEPAQRADARSGVNAADASGMAGAPGFQQVEGFGSAHVDGPPPVQRSASFRPV